MRGDRAGQVAGGRARDDLEAQLLRPRQRHRHDAVLEGMRGIGGVVLDPHLAQAEALGEPVGARERREAGRQRAARRAAQGKEVGVAPDRVRARLDAPAQPVDVHVLLTRVGDLEGPEAALADVAGVERVFG